MDADKLELTLYDLSTKREARTSYAEGADKFLQRYRLDGAAVQAVMQFDIRALQQSGVSALLTYGFWMTNHPSRSRQEYLCRLNGQE